MDGLPPGFCGGIFFKIFPQKSSSCVFFRPLPGGIFFRAAGCFLFLLCHFGFLYFLCRKKTFKCLNCGEMHIQDPRSKGQRFCHQDLCRRASHARSQRQWLSKPQNRDYFTGPVNTERARQWRKANPGYWRKRKDPQNKAQQDLIDTYLAYVEDVGCSDTRKSLQDFIKAQTAIMVGFASILTGSAQQDEIATILRSCLTRGADVYGNQPEASQAHRVQNTKAKHGNADKHRPPGP